MTEKLIERIIPVDELAWLRLRRQDVTSTDVAALFGCSPYVTSFELWHRKHDNLEVTFEPNERMRWGNRLQDAIAQGIAEDQGWKVRRMSEYLRDPEARMGASFDYEFTDGAVTGILEIKNVDALAFKDGWIVDGDNVEAPPHIEIQVQHQVALADVPIAYIGALVGGNRVVLIKREPDVPVIGAIRKRVREFWDSVDLHQPPPPDFVRDAGFISKLYGYAEPGRVINAESSPRILQLALEYKAASEQESRASKAKDAAKAELLTIIGDAEKVMGEGFSITAGMIGPQHIEYDRAGYRNWRVNWKKAKP